MTLLLHNILSRTLKIPITFVRSRRQFLCYTMRMTGLGITPERVARAIWLYKQGEPLAAIQKATTIPMKHLKRIIAKYDLRFGDDGWARLLDPMHRWMNDVARASALRIDE